MTTTRTAPDRRARPSHRIADLLTGRRTAWAVALVPVLLAVAVMVGVGEGERTTRSTDGLPDGYDSTAGTALLDRLPRDTTTTAVVLFTADAGELTRDQLARLQDAAAELGRTGTSPTGAVPTQSGPTQSGPTGAGPDQSGPDQGGPGLLPSQDGTAALTVVALPSGSATEVADEVGHLRTEADRLAPDGVTAQVTGPAAVQADLAAVFDGANTRLLLVTALVVAVLLVVTYRSPVLWLVPLLVVGIADRFASVAATQLMAALDVAWDGSTTGILSVLVFGAGTDYALLLISRYRDELRRQESRHAAMATALRRTSEAVLASATTVVLGLLTLLLSVFPTTRGLGLACAVGVVVAAAFALVVLPATLVVCGRWVFWPKVPHLGEQVTSESGTVFHRVGERVARRPGVVVAGTLVLLAVLATGLGSIRLGLDQADQFLDRPESIAASERLAQSFPAGLADPTTVVTTDDGRQVLDTVRSTDGVTSARISGSGAGITVVDAVLSTDDETGTLHRLRSALASYDDTHVTGPRAQALDARDASGRDRLLILPLILVLVLVGLALLLRAVVAPVLLVLTVVATYVAALGASWWLFTGPLGFDALDSSVPLLAFLFLVALGVDYNIFLVTRAREEAAEAGSRGGMLRSLSATGGVITSAGILLAAVFAVLGVLPLVVLAQLGTIICLGVLLDTLVVRTLLVPALALVLGDRFWWPRRPA
ncbi:MMPL family transporter [Nocardioides panaciterrulae]|uniref:RND superfamily putative drug exporter n=1 Tax=Nocardioides panaciterrulae TaxID=661492 RepID=A0A7Y9JE43_9ACTN|nr:RND superfamily putative drug exporter [Nocardioides panaciterrulae]